MHKRMTDARRGALRKPAAFPAAAQKLSEREWARQSCGARRHGDVNAAINLEKMASAKLQAS
jgi:transposase